MFGRTPLKDRDFAELYSILGKKNIPIQTLSRGEIFFIEEVKIEVLYPNPDSDTDAASDNNHSFVVRLTYGSRSFLFTGDIESAAEGDLLSTPQFLHADIVKVAHHGSRTSSTQAFIDAAAPEFAIISVGKRRSRFGHPHREVVNRWLAANAKIITTGESGTISFSTDGTDLIFDTFLKDEQKR